MGLGDAGKLFMVPLTGTQHEISAGDYRATVTELGAGLRALHYLGRPVIGEYSPDILPPGASGQLLAPWPNRVDGGRYTIDGTQYQLDLSEPGHLNAIHGLTRWAGWDVAARTSEAVSLRHVLLGRQGYPFCLDIGAEYLLGADSGLQVSITARNAGSAAAPYGTGSHPYLAAGTPAIDDCELLLPGGMWLPADERGIPSGPVQDVTGTPFDFRESRALAGTRLDQAPAGGAGPPVRPGAGRAGPPVRLPRTPGARRDAPRSRAYRPDPRCERPRLGTAGRRRNSGRALGGSRLPVAPGVHRRHARPRASAPGPRRGADDLPPQCLRFRGGPAPAGAGRQRDAHLGYPGDRGLTVGLTAADH